jgi:hypothetical protein
MSLLGSLNGMPADPLLSSVISHRLEIGSDGSHVELRRASNVLATYALTLDERLIATARFACFTSPAGRLTEVSVHGGDSPSVHTSFNFSTSGGVSI